MTLNGNYEGVRARGGGNTIGGSTPAARNVIAGNAIGIYAEFARVTGNYIGWDPSGLREGFGNGTGVVLEETNILGGAEPGAGNLIGNNTVGVQVSGTTGCRIRLESR